MVNLCLGKVWLGQREEVGTTLHGDRMTSVENRGLKKEESRARTQLGDKAGR